MSWVMPAIATGGALLGGLGSFLSGNDAAKDAAKAAKKALKFQKKVWQKNWEAFAPYRSIGLESLYQLAGYSPVQQQLAPGVSSQPGVNNLVFAQGFPSGQPQLQPGKTQSVRGVGTGGGSRFKSPPTYRDFLNMGLQGGFDAFEQWRNRQIASPDRRLPVATKMQQPQAPSVSWQKTGTGYDPTGGAWDFLNQLKEFSKNFQFNPEDITYKFKQGEQEKAIDRYLASRGLYNSRPGLNMLSEANRALVADEAQRQYQRGYGRLVDLYNMSKALGGIGYSKLMDLIKLGTGATSATGQLGLGAGQQVGSSYTNIGLTDLAKGRLATDFYSGLGALPLNFMILQNLFQKPSVPLNYQGPHPGY